MNTFLFVTKPKFAPERVKEETDIFWCCSGTTRAGDHAVVYVTGIGICYKWCALSDAQRTQGRPWPYECHIKYVDAFVSPITITELRVAISRDEWKPPHLNFRGYRAIKIPSEVLGKIKALRPTLHEVEQKFSEDIAASLKLTSTERLKHLASAPKNPAKSTVTTEVFNRDPHVVAAVLIRAAGHCECCKSAAPFKRASNGEPYLEVHHKIWLARGGEDTKENAVALCPNCHRKAHYGYPSPAGSV